MNFGPSEEHAQPLGVAGRTLREPIKSKEIRTVKIVRKYTNAYSFMQFEFKLKIILVNIPFALILHRFTTLKSFVVGGLRKFCIHRLFEMKHINMFLGKLKLFITRVDGIVMLCFARGLNSIS